MSDKFYLVKIPVLPFVKKVLLKEFGPEPLKIKGDTLLGKQVMSFVFDLQGDFQPPEIRVYGVTVDVEFSTRLWRYMNRYHDLFQSGMFFERMCQRMMLQHILAQVRTGRVAWQAMMDFFDLYDIDEDDYAAMSAYELWKLWKKAHPELIPSKHADNILV